MRWVAVMAAAALLGGCATSVAPVEVTRFHLGEPIARGTVIVLPLGGGEPSLEYRSYALAVEAELQRVGYTVARDNLGAEFVADVGFLRANRVAPRDGSGVSVGLGAGSGGYGSGVGVGGGVSFPIGGRRGDIVASELSVRIKRRQGEDVIWEGRAQTEARESNPATQPGIAAGKLASALFAGFPGRSGETITVR